MVERWQAALRRRYGSADYARLNENMRRTFSKVISQDLYPFLKDIQAPTLLVWGSEDTETPLWMGNKWRKPFPMRAWWCSKAGRILHSSRNGSAS